MEDVSADDLVSGSEQMQCRVRNQLKVSHAGTPTPSHPSEVGGTGRTSRATSLHADLDRASLAVVDADHRDRYTRIEVLGEIDLDPPHL